MNIIDLAKKFHVWVSVTFNVGKGETPKKGVPPHVNGDNPLDWFNEPTIAPVEYIDDKEKE